MASCETQRDQLNDESWSHKEELEARQLVKPGWQPLELIAADLEHGARSVDHAQSSIVAP